MVSQERIVYADSLLGFETQILASLQIRVTAVHYNILINERCFLSAAPGLDISSFNSSRYLFFSSSLYCIRSRFNTWMIILWCWTAITVILWKRIQRWRSEFIRRCYAVPVQDSSTSQTNVEMLYEHCKNTVHPQTDNLGAS